MLYEVISHEGISIDAFPMCLLPHTIKDDARGWLHLLLVGSIVNWDDIMHKFTMKLFLPSGVH